MAKVLRTYQLKTPKALAEAIAGEITLLTRGVSCKECVEILIEKSLHDTVCPEDPTTGTMLGFKFRVVHGPGVRPGSLAVITRTEILFK